MTHRLRGAVQKKITNLADKAFTPLPLALKLKGCMRKNQTFYLHVQILVFSKRKFIKVIFFHNNQKVYFISR